MSGSKSIFVGASLLALALAAQPSLAQEVTADPAAAVPAPQDVPEADAPSQDGEIVVTGSRIPRRNLDTGQPTQVLSSDLVEARGYTNVADALNDLPSFGVPGSSRVGGQAGAFGSGQNFVNFFGLGDQRTLTIVNGRRFVSSNTASIFGPTGAGVQVDLNVIPTLLLDRVETIAVGGAPIYGSDAIAGTVNVITKRKYQGIQLDAQYGLSERGDGSEFRIRGLAGTNFAGGRGNITIAGEYSEEQGLTNAARSNRRINSFFTTPLDPNAPFDNGYIGDRRIPSLSEFGVPLVSDAAIIGIPLSPAQAAAFGGQPGVTDAAGNPLTFDATGNLVPINFGQQTGNLINFDGGNGFVLPGNLLTPVRRYLATALAEYEISDGIRLFGEAWYANSRGEQLRDQPVYNTGLFGAAGDPDGNLILSVNNPYLTAAARQTIVNSLASNPITDAAPGTFYLGRANTDLVSGAGASTVELYRFVGGIDGDFQALGRQMKFELVGNYGRSTTQGNERVLVQQNFLNALNAVRDASGNIVCAPGAVSANIATISSTCAPINPFGQQISQAARDYVTAIADPRAVNEQWVVTASVSGTLFDLPGGGAGFVLGYEHRNESADFNPGAFYAGELQADGTRTQFGRSVPIDAVAGSFNTDEFFTEVRLPILGPDQNIPFINSFELHGAARYIDNSLAGGDWTYTGDARWELVRGLAFRANYTRSVRAPAVTELFNPTSQIFTTANDPCDSRFINNGPNPATRAANCAAAGLPAGFKSNIVDFTSRGSLSGNPTLQNETAKAFTVGAILAPRFLPGFTATVDWVDIRLSGAIESLDATQVLEGCFDGANYPGALCSNITRDPTGQVTFVETGYANAASRKLRALVAEVGYRTDLPFLGGNSAIDLRANYQYLDELVVRVGEGDRSTLRNSIGYSPHKATVNAAYSNDTFAWSWQWLYYGPTKNDPDAPDTTYQYPNVGSTSFFNTTMNFKVDDRFSLRFIVNNVFDAGPPFPVPANGGTTAYFDGFFGRSFRVGTNIRF